SGTTMTTVPRTVYSIGDFVFGTNHTRALYAAGNFAGAGAFASGRNIAAWDGSAWFPLGNGMGQPSGGTGGSGLATTRAVISYDDGLGGGPALYACGSFPYAGGVAVNHVARWNCAQWSPVGG